MTAPRTDAGRLPIPDWSRPGETWRIEAENEWHPTDRGGCSSKCCHRVAVAWQPRNGHGLCEVHLTSGLMWIENDQVVSWALRP
jgi:hypothetical protein